METKYNAHLEIRFSQKRRTDESCLVQTLSPCHLAATFLWTAVSFSSVPGKAMCLFAPISAFRTFSWSWLYAALL